VKYLFWIVLIMSSQAVIAGCPKKNIHEYTYMTKEDLIAEYCRNDSDYISWGKLYAAYSDEYHTLESHGTDLAISLSEKMFSAKEQMSCSAHNRANVFCVLSTGHRIEKEEDIKCE